MHRPSVQPRWPTLRWTLREAGVYAMTAMVVGFGILIAGAIVLGNGWEPPVAIGTLVALAIAAIAIRRMTWTTAWQTFPRGQRASWPYPLMGQAPGTVGARAWDTIRKLATVTDHLRTLEKVDASIKAQLLELNRVVLDLTRDVSDMIGQMKSIEKRLDDRDRLVEATIKLRITEEIAKLRDELRRG